MHEASSILAFVDVGKEGFFAPECLLEEKKILGKDLGAFFVRRGQFITKITGSGNLFKEIGVEGRASSILTH